MNLPGLPSNIVMRLTTRFDHIYGSNGKYHFGTKLWSIFLIGGFSCMVISNFVNNKRLFLALRVPHFYDRFMNSLSKKSGLRGWLSKNPDRIYYFANKKVEVI